MHNRRQESQKRSTAAEKPIMAHMCKVQPDSNHSALSKEKENVKIQPDVIGVCQTVVFSMWNIYRVVIIVLRAILWMAVGCVSAYKVQLLGWTQYMHTNCIWGQWGQHSRTTRARDQLKWGAMVNHLGMFIYNWPQSMNHIILCYIRNSNSRVSRRTRPYCQFSKDLGFNAPTLERIWVIWAEGDLHSYLGLSRPRPVWWC